MEPLSTSQILDIDREHIWHPYSSLTRPIPAYPVVGAKGVRIQLADGRELIDGMASWWSVLHGYNHPALNQAARQQIDNFSHIMFGGLTHEPAARLCKTLVDVTPEGLNKVFLSDSGSVSVEVAMKMAIQYWQSLQQPGKTRFLSLRNGYHGDTFGAMSICDPITGMHHLFKGVIQENLFAEAPSCKFEDTWDDSCIADFKQLIERHHRELAAVTLEPIVQGTGGMRFYSPHYLKRVRTLCDQYDVLLIADEIATGFGRTGKFFACEWAEITPDILCLGKALTAGYMTLAGTLCTDKISNGICHGEAGVFMHGPTFMGNPLACAVANCNIELLLQNDWHSQVQRISALLKNELSSAKSLPNVADIRVLGAIGIIEMTQPVDLPKFQKQCVDKGIWVRPFGKLVYVMPPYITSNEDLTVLTRTLVEIVKKH
ncbi:MAG: adenosylmethionine--8-amino-7-oxononanoate transaminase [Pseudomonadales bacterium]|nr:adenosylmethionine--8-amino-7-oxononanoate transaminase [Pseudomonadales bacterium]